MQRRPIDKRSVTGRFTLLGFVSGAFCFFLGGGSFDPITGPHSDALSLIGAF